ncbi:M16 family metallopeptidase [Clostridium sp.]|uniref:M16 family metallopeptidase n=1 Tax=Clostridium sp. TaxID=1506 RepID=UPI003D6CF73B
MEKIILKNGIKLLYKSAENNLTSFTIGFNAGANSEKKEQLGIAHMVEHMVFKGTASLTEYQINKLCDETFGFCNAMTNYPYVVYYGTTLDEDFEKGFEIYSDILINPTFPLNGFKEEVGVIIEELKDWKDDLNQCCEDSMYYNCFRNRRLKNLIIGTEESIHSITIEQIIDFYHKHYTADNCVVSVVSSMSLTKVSEIVEKHLYNFNPNHSSENCILDENEEYVYENNNPGTYFEYKDGIQGAKIQYCFSIQNLNSREISALKLFNLVFGEGTSSILYHEIRTKRGLVYDIGSKIKNETGIKLFIISLGTSYENVHNTIKIINDEIEKVKKLRNYFDEQCILKLCKSYKLKRMLAIEKSIQTSMNLCVHEIMYANGLKIFSKIQGMQSISESEIMAVVNSVLVNPTIQVLMPNLNNDK